MKIINLLMPVILAGLLFTSGCSTIKGVFGKQSEKVQVTQNVVTKANEAIADNTSKKLSTVSEYAYGINLSTNISTAHTLNERIESLAGAPSIVQEREMQSIVHQLQTNNSALLLAKDRQIAEIQSTELKLDAQRSQAISQVETLSSQLALQTDASTQQLSRYHSFFGLGAVVLGVWQFVTTSLWFILGAVVVFFILRALADINPIFGTAFSIFEGIGYGLIKCIEYLVPNAVQSVAKDIQAIESEVVPATNPVTPTTTSQAQTIPVASTPTSGSL